MEFYPNQLFHIYNQGNNRRQIFLSDDNYRFFLWKMRAYLQPFGDLVAYCLMPTHFHWLFYVRKVTVKRKEHRVHIDRVEYIRRVAKYGKNAQPLKQSHTRYAAGQDSISLNDSIGLLQQGYTQAINRKQGWRGSLFRKNCKAKDGWIDEFVTLRKANGYLDPRFMPGSEYKYRCLFYIHENPVKAGLVKRAEDWMYSSAKDYLGLRQGTLCNLEMGKAIIDFIA